MTKCCDRNSFLMCRLSTKETQEKEKIDRPPLTELTKWVNDCCFQTVEPVTADPIPLQISARRELFFLFSWILMSCWFVSIFFVSFEIIILRHSTDINISLGFNFLFAASTRHVETFHHQPNDGDFWLWLWRHQQLSTQKNARSKRWKKSQNLMKINIFLSSTQILVCLISLI